MKILVLNCGSSSIKYQLFNIEDEEILAKGIVQKIGMNGSFLENKRSDGDKVKLEGEILDHESGIGYILGVLTSEQHGSLKSLDEIDAVGHRVVHGGEEFNSSVLITNEVVKKMEECIDLAPLHNPPNLKGIYSMQELLPSVPQVGVFDTAFHQSMPAWSYMYAIPYSLYEKYGLRRYGFHGTSHRYVSKRACEFLKLNYENQKIITCHLGNGSSIAAIKNGKSLDTSMGLTPVEGLMMGTRTGDLDLGVLLYIMDKEEIGTQAANTLINKHSGVLGISGVSSDMRDVEDSAADGNERARLALDMFHYRIRKYIGAYVASMGGVDVIVFTGGIGENGPESREEICKDFEYLGLRFDHEKNKGLRSKEADLSQTDSNVKVVVIPTDEELVIARDTFEIVKGS
ncbi:MAG: acetate kinase [Bacteroidales bacterium]|nr:acetate kinase [Bacteroidales bacterium]MCF8351135.1 acetate kinase [Bacteroidales bacterium]MCF8374803.1 acetate kinase [Bacteroidales bacterium]MCF8399793.1 acetate kinase [Bacteroidales bacterium]